jgi:hypothetical protein
LNCSHAGQHLPRTDGFKIAVELLIEKNAARVKPSLLSSGSCGVNFTSNVPSACIVIGEPFSLGNKAEGQTSPYCQPRAWATLYETFCHPRYSLGE